MGTRSPEAAKEILATMEMLHEHIIRAFMSDARSRRVSCMKMPVTLPQARALEIIATNRGLNNKQLAQALQISPASASAMVDRLAELKLVERYIPDEDRRTVRLQTSALGARTFRVHRQVVERVISEMFDRLGESDARKWLQASRKIRMILTSPALPPLP